MSWLDDIIDFGSSVIGGVTDFFNENPIVGSLAKTAIAGLAVHEIQQSINRDNNNKTETKVDPGVRIQVEPNPNQKIPVVYGRAVVSGIITDAVLTNSNQTMFYCLTLCEKTGNLNLGNGNASQITFKDIYWNNQRLIFANDGVTVSSAIDGTNAINTAINGLIKIYCYSGSSGATSIINSYSSGATTAAYNIMPGWTSSHMMNNLVFAIIRIDYNATAGTTGLGDLKFVLENSMTQAGDCLWDYMTNTRYGAGINPNEIYKT